MGKIGYEAPLARDLSALGADGQWPLYACTSGFLANDPGDRCSGGAQANANCTDGMFYSAQSQPCTSGSSPSSGECVTGTGATNQSCTSGGGVA